MTKFIVTFGSGQLGTLGLYHHVEVEAPDELTARRLAGQAFDGKWSGIYLESTKYPEKYGTGKLGRLIFSHESPDGKIYWETRRD